MDGSLHINNVFHYFLVKSLYPLQFVAVHRFLRVNNEKFNIIQHVLVDGSSEIHNIYV